MNEDYKLKTDDELKGQISEFGDGVTEFHTADIERLIREKDEVQKELEELRRHPRLVSVSLSASPTIHEINFTASQNP